jgi:hypothetical protein
VACLALAGCAEIGEPDIGSPPVTASTAETVPDEGDPSEGASGIASPQLAPARPEGYLPSLVVASDHGVVLVAEGESPQLLSLVIEPATDEAEAVQIPGSPTLAIDDFFRGLVVEFDTGDVHWFQAEGGAARRINSNGGRLLDVGFFNGTTEAILAVGLQIDRIRLADTQRFPLFGLNPNQLVLDFSAGGGLYVSAIADDECGSLLFMNAIGEEVLVSLPPAGPCEIVRRPKFGSVALSSDGGAVAYTIVAYRADGVEAQTSLVVVDLSSGGVVLSTPVGSSGDRISGLSFDGQRVAMIRESGNAEVELLVATDAEVLEVDLVLAAIPATATWARLPVAVGTAE